MKKIRINGPIVNDSESWIYEWLDLPHVSPASINEEIDSLEANGEQELLVLINSGGGSVFAASEIYHALKSYGLKNTVKIEISSIAASAASLLAMAATESELAIAPTGQIMIHNAICTAQGDYREMDDTGEFLKKINQSIINAYSSRTGMAENELKNMMDKETYMTAQEAIEKGFVDKILFEKDLTNSFVASDNSVAGALPESVVREMKNKLATGEINLGEKNINVSNVINSKKIVTNVNKKEEGGLEMNKEKLKNEHPELFEEIKDEGFEEGVQAENARIKDIEELSMPGNENLINDAKYKGKIDAKDLAINIIRAEKKKGVNFINDTKTDAAEASKVGASDGVAGLDNDKDDKSKAKVNNFVEFYNGGVK